MFCYTSYEMMISGLNEQLQHELEYTLLKPDCHSWWISHKCNQTHEKNDIKFCFKNLEKMPQKRMECFRLLLEHLAWIEHQFLSGIRDSRKAGSLWGMMRGVGGVWQSEHQSRLAKGLGLGLLCWGFKGVQEEIPSEEAITLQNRARGISTRTMHQSTTPSLSLTIWPRWASRQFLSLPIVHDLAPCNFWLFPKLRGCRYETTEEMKRRLWRRSLTGSHKRTSMGTCRGCWNSRTSVLPAEEITSKWTKGFMCVLINKSAHTEKVWKLI